jgi:hypothetical protein
VEQPRAIIAEPATSRAFDAIPRAPIVATLRGSASKALVKQGTHMLTCAV